MSNQNLQEFKEKAVFVWYEPKPLITLPDRLFFRPAIDGVEREYLSAIEQVVCGSLDSEDRALLKSIGAKELASRYYNVSKDYFDYRPEWWQLAYRDDELIGFTQPVIFRDCQKDGLEEGTIHYIGVIPSQRGQGYIYDLLCAATLTLQKVGVWRIDCDTDILNQPMIDAFKQVGYVQEGVRKVPYYFT